MVHAMQRMLQIVFTFVPFLAHGLFLGEIENIQTSSRGRRFLSVRHVANSSMQKQAPRDEHLVGHPPRAVLLERSRRRLDGRHVEQSSTSNHAALEKRLVDNHPNKSYKQVFWGKWKGFISAVRSTELSNGLAVRMFLVFSGVLVMCVAALMEALDCRSHRLRDECRTSGNVRAPLSRIASGSEGESIPIGRGHGYRLISRRPSRAATFVSRNATKSLYLDKPAPLCPELVPVVESWFAVGFQGIDRAAGPFPIYGRGKQLLFTAQIQIDALGIGCVTLRSGDGPGPLLGSITSTGESLIVQDKRRQTYGEISSTGNLVYSLRCGGVDTMRFSDAHTGKICVVNPNDGTHLASAAKLHDVSELQTLEDHLEIKVVAGMDPALTILCIIALMALTPK